jgi:methenyltetrahydrofolate cyclohydrolase
VSQGDSPVSSTALSGTQGLSSRSLWELSSAELLSRTASSAPTPGGGSVAAISGALGLSLVIMALEISDQRHKDSHPGDRQQLSGLLVQTRALLTDLKAHPDADVSAFGSYMAALALPKQGESQRAARKEAIQAAALAATAAPLACARDLLAALRLAEQAVSLSHRHLVSDVGAGGCLLGAALQATLLNVDINLSSLPAEQGATAQAERQELAAKGRLKAMQIAALVSDRLAR